MPQRNRLYEGKAKVLYEGPREGTLVQYFKDDATAFNKKKHEVIDGKGVLNNYISAFLFTKLNELGITTHFIERLNRREQLVYEVDILPVEVVVRNVVAGSMAKRFGLEEGQVLPRPVIDYFYKSDELCDPMITEDHITIFEWATEEEIHDIVGLALRINDFMTGLFLGIGIKLIDFKIEFGRFHNGDETLIMLADEISPDTCRLWDIETNKKLDKDRFRRDLGDFIESYRDVAQRLGINLEDLALEEKKAVLVSDEKTPKKRSSKKK